MERLTFVDVRHQQTAGEGDQPIQAGIIQKDASPFDIMRIQVAKGIDDDGGRVGPSSPGAFQVIGCHRPRSAFSMEAYDGGGHAPYLFQRTVCGIHSVIGFRDVTRKINVCPAHSIVGQGIDHASVVRGSRGQRNLLALYGSWKTLADELSG